MSGRGDGDVGSTASGGSKAGGGAAVPVANTAECAGGIRERGVLVALAVVVGDRRVSVRGVVGRREAAELGGKC